MMGGKAAALTILDMRRTGDFSKQSCKQYERRWVLRGGDEPGAACEIMNCEGDLMMSMSYYVCP